MRFVVSVYKKVQVYHTRKRSTTGPLLKEKDPPNKCGSRNKICNTSAACKYNPRDDSTILVKETRSTKS